ncbi:hypothetical protein BCR34DRAFT_338154 [Clohesyomyces aquaticus]|uniref:C2H2-type domain-containing protein n=1 Tax=Clohesyomyces aquaticus TaxID=1231657 RepID=A0A1Y1ZM03_9PLEO|nr:hypothetical protein BCR34DRAFT_338154 [Clohesyomyces aquaticus]
MSGGVDPGSSSPESKPRALLRLLCHYLIYIGKATSLLESASDENALVKRWKSPWNKPAAFTWNRPNGLEMHYRIDQDWIVSNSENESMSSIDIDLDDLEDGAEFTLNSDLLKCTVCETFWTNLDENGRCQSCQVGLELDEVIQFPTFEDTPNFSSSVSFESSFDISWDFSIPSTCGHAPTPLESITRSISSSAWPGWSFGYEDASTPFSQQPTFTNSGSHKLPQYPESMSSHLPVPSVLHQCNAAATTSYSEQTAMNNLLCGPSEGTSCASEPENLGTPTQSHPSNDHLMDTCSASFESTGQDLELLYLQQGVTPRGIDKKDNNATHGCTSISTQRERKKITSRDWRCSMCAKYFSREDSLRMHLQSHQTEEQDLSKASGAQGTGHQLSPSPPDPPCSNGITRDTSHSRLYHVPCSCCLISGDTVWVIAGHYCPRCGTPVPLFNGNGVSRCGKDGKGMRLLV